MTVTTRKHPVRTNLLRMAGGAVVGGSVTALVLFSLGKRHIDPGDASAMLALVAGLVYVLMGLIVAVGTMLPRAGALYLNVEDAGELREERRKLGLSAAACILFGLFLLALLLSGPDGGLIDRPVALVIAGVSLIASTLIGIASYRYFDELTRQINQEAGAVTLQLMLLLVGGWATLAHLGYVGWASPLALISILALLQLAAIFVVAARHGLMTPR